MTHDKLLPAERKKLPNKKNGLRTKSLNSSFSKMRRFAFQSSTSLENIGAPLSLLRTPKYTHTRARTQSAEGAINGGVQTNTFKTHELMNKNTWMHSRDRMLARTTFS